jgi:hypothetical protein
VTVDELLTELQVSNSLIVAEGAGNYTLGHLSYQEYLVALAVVHEQRASLLADRFYEPYWRQVVIFYAGIAGNAERLLEMVQGRSPLVNQEGLLDELNQEARYTPEHVRAFIEEDETVPERELPDESSEELDDFGSEIGDDVEDEDDEA